LSCLGDLAQRGLFQRVSGKQEAPSSIKTGGFFAFGSFDLDRTGQIKQEIIWPEL
jgi:hypothetical protein